MRYRAVIFDLDGVICSTDRYHYQAWKELADRLGLPFDEETNRNMRGVSRLESLEILLQAGGVQYGGERKAELAREKDETYRRLLEQMSPGDVPGGVRKALDKLRRNGLKLAIGSSSKNAPLILEKLGLRGFFDAVADGTQISRSKPDPEVFLLAARKLGMRPAECLVVEDARAGVLAANAGKFDVAFFGEQPGGEEALFRVGSIEKLAVLLAGTEQATWEGEEYV